MRTAVARLGRRPQKRSTRSSRLIWSSTTPSRLISSPPAKPFNRNTEVEFQRNPVNANEFLKWGQKAFENFRVVPPMTGIIHSSIWNIYRRSSLPELKTAGPTLPGYAGGHRLAHHHDQRLGVVGWASAASKPKPSCVGQPMDMLLPDVIGFKLVGKLRKDHRHRPGADRYPDAPQKRRGR